MRKILLACEKPNKRPPDFRHLIPNRPAQHRILRLQCIQRRPLRRRPLDLQLHFMPHPRMHAKMLWQNNTNHEIQPLECAVLRSLYILVLIRVMRVIRGLIRYPLGVWLHFNVCTSTDTTAGKSRTIGAQ